MRKRILDKVNNGVIACNIKTRRMAEKVAAKLKDNSGNFLEEALKYIIAIVIGALFLAGIYALFKTVIIPKLGTKVTDAFDYSA